MGALKHADSQKLFSAHPHEPFQAGQPFAWTFFNLFNYQNGLLNPHVDRSLLTVIYSSPPSSGTATTSSTLWIQDRHGAWHDGDRAAAKEDQVVVMVGEELAETGIAANLDLIPALHAVKVDPQGPNISRPHFRPDPAQQQATVGGAVGESNYRLSAALILRHDLG